MARRTLYLPVLIVAAVLMGCAPAVLAVSGKAEAAFPGKNGHIAYVRNDGQDYEIYAIDGGGGDKTQLTNDNTGSYAPSYSPGGKKIAYSGSSGSGDTEIYTIDAGGGGKTPLTRNDRDDFYPSYSPNGKKIVYMHDGANDSELYTIDVRTRHRVQLTRNDRDDFYPSYSPSGKKIVCSGSSSSGDTEIYTIDAGGGGVRFNSPTTTPTSSTPTIHLTARGSPTRCTKDPLPVSTRSMSTEGASSASPPALSTRSLLPGGVVRSDFSCRRWAIGLED